MPPPALGQISSRRWVVIDEQSTVGGPTAAAQSAKPLVRTLLLQTTRSQRSQQNHSLISSSHRLIGLFLVLTQVRLAAGMPPKKVVSARAFSAAKCAECLDNSNEGEADFPRVRTECSECWCAKCCLQPTIRKYCALCGGSQVCIHGKRRVRCKTCSAGKVAKEVQRKKQKREENPEQHRIELIVI